MSALATGRATGPTQHADVIIVGAGPAGSTTACYLASAGLDVLLLEKTRFPRDKVCGDGLTPRAAREIENLGLPTTAEHGWRKNKGLRLIGGGHSLEMPWPDISAYPNYGLVRTRHDFDAELAAHAENAGARLLQQHAATGPVIDDKTGRVTGVTVRETDASGRKTGGETTYRAPIVVAADGISARMAMALGLEKRSDRPMGVAVRTYYSSPRHDDEWMESWVELRAMGAEGRPGPALPGYGWVFGVGDGTSNVGLGILNSSKRFGKVDYRKILKQWTEATPDEWGFRDENQVGKVRGAALPMAFNRTPQYVPGMLLVGDSAGMVNPFNGEGIAYAMEAGRIAADTVAQALTRRPTVNTDRELAGYPQRMEREWGSYFTLGRGFVEVIGRPKLMALGIKYGMSSTTLMRFVVKLLANLTEDHRHPRDAYDRVIDALNRLAPATSNQ